MDEAVERRHTDTFLVKVYGGDGSDVVGQVQHVLTGETYQFRGLAELGGAIARMKGRGTPRE